MRTKQAPDDQPLYGVSEHYLGDKGQDYTRFAVSRAFPNRGKIHALKFEPYISSDDTVVDFGCGHGDILAALRCGRRIGIEANPFTRKLAEARGIECYPTVDAVPAGIADVVISNHVLEHVPYPIAALTELRSLLKPNGLLVACVPIDDWRRRYNPNDINHHLHTWTPLLFGNTLVEAGYHVRPDDIRIITQYTARPLFYMFPYLPRPLFDLIRTLWAIPRHYRELLAAVRLGDGHSGDRETELGL